MNWGDKTVSTYDNSAIGLAKKFRGIGARVYDIDLGLKMAKTKVNSKVIEIGCGDGRDAEEIVKRVGYYEGFDPSGGMLEIAKKRLPHASFVQAGALSYVYPENVDVIFAFASLLHVDKKGVESVLKKASQSLRLGGIFYISLKEKPEYTAEVKNDEYGERMFYYYNIDLINNLAGNLFVAEYEDRQKIGNTDWFTVALKKK